MDDKRITKEEFSQLPKDQQEQVLANAEKLEKAQESIANDETSLSKMSMKDLKEAIGETVKHYTKPMTKVDRKFAMLPGVGYDDPLVDDTTDKGKFAKTAKFLRAMVQGDVQTVRGISEEARKKANLSEGTATEGGFLVPEEFKNEILRLAPEYGVIRSAARIIPMRYDVVSIPSAGSTDQSAIWTQEAAQIKQTDPNFGQVQLVASKLAAIPKMTNELLADSPASITQYLTELIAEQFAKAEDVQGFRGIGEPFVGVLTSSGVPSQAIAGTVSTLSYPDLVNATGLLYSNVVSGSKFYFHRSVVTHLRSLITTTGAAIFAPQAVNIIGFPLISAEALWSISQLGASAGTNFGVFGDLRRGLAFGERGTVQMKIGTEGTVGSDNLFEQDMVAIRVTERVALGVLLPSAFCSIVTA